MIKNNIIDLNNNIDEQMEELQIILSRVSKDVKFLVMWKDLRDVIGEFQLDIKVEIPFYHHEQVISFMIKQYLPVVFVKDSIKYYVYEKIINRVGLDKL